jgi:hypothetical protein
MANLGGMESGPANLPWLAMMFQQRKRIISMGKLDLPSGFGVEIE